MTRERNRLKYLYETVKNLYSTDPKLLIIEPKTMFQPKEQFQSEFWTFTMKEEQLKNCNVKWWIYNSKGKVASGEFAADVAPDSAQKVGVAKWDIPQDASGFHSLICSLTDSNGKRLFQNDLHFDVAVPEKPAVLWIEAVDKGGKPLAGVTAEARKFVKTTGVFGRVPFLLNAGGHVVTVTTLKGKNIEIKTKVESGSSRVERIVCE